MKDWAVAYCRVSTKKQAQQGESLDDQSFVCADIARRKDAIIEPNGRIFSDSFSGRKDKRPEFDEAMEFIRNNVGKVRYFIVRDISRLTRGGSVSYGQLKSELTKYGVELVDSYGIVQPPQNTLERQGFAYDWSIQSPSEMSELIIAQNSKSEVTTILTRLIGQEINLVKQGYRVRAPNDGYKNSKVFTDEGKKKTIQIPDPERSKFFIEMFRLRAENNYDDQEICKLINAMGFRSLEKNKWDKNRKKIIGKVGGQKLTPKMLQSFIKKPAYCGVICEKWTHFQPVRTPYESLVSIDLFNQANRGKVFIKERPDGSLEIFYNLPNKPIIRRNKNNRLYPFRNIILCPFCHKPFKGSASKGKAGKHYANYHCSRGHRYFGVPKITFEDNVKGFIHSLELNRDFLNVLENKLVKEYRKHQTELLQTSATIHRHIADLENRKEQAIDSIIDCTSPVVKKELEKKVEALEQEIKEAKEQSNKAEMDESDVSAFLRYANYFMEHIDEMLLNTEDMKAQQALFGLVFEEFPTYHEIISGTPKLSLVFETKKTSRDEKSLLVTSKTLFSNLLLGGQDLCLILEEWNKSAVVEPEPEPVSKYELVLIL